MFIQSDKIKGVKMELIQHDYIQVDINAIKPYENNARLHSSIQINQIMQSIKEFGFTNPLIIDTEYNLIAGHGRLEALKQLNKIDFKDNPILQVPCIQVKDLSDTQKRALCLADNQIALNSTWDNEKLQDELEKLINENFNFDCLGFDDSVFDGFIDDELNYDELNDDFTIPSNDKSGFKKITITLKTEHAEAILLFQKENQKTQLANGDNYNANANIIWNLLKDRL